MNSQVSKKEKIEALLQSRDKTIERLRRIQRRMRKEEENPEQVWPGHDSTRYHFKIIEYETLLAHLIEIEKELKKLGP